jgi:abnormal spindle-like microcephaly-associated protein
MNEDINPDSDCLNLELWRLQRTLLRSLMLVKVLDMTKTLKNLAPVPNLFQTGSQHKSSISVLQHLIRMLNPSIGDPMRPLSHLGYLVNHSQYPLEEYNYQTTNLAIDMRDGVRLTRLVELLLYRSASSTLSHIQDSEGTCTLQIPSGETLSLTEGRQDWPLSQYLKFPCLGRATRLYNNQIAMTALQGIKGISTLFQEVSAEDIVDGYREKTVRLLWALTSKWGLGGLVDWDDVKSEVRRLERSQGKARGDTMSCWDLDEDVPGHIQYKSLLRAWVGSVGCSHGLAVRNFTTSFADGKVFEAIVNEYQPYLLGDSQLDASIGFDARLKALGCSEPFTRLFAVRVGHSSTHIFDRDFVLASLAFLCSRLLGPSKKARAAVTIQRGWRRYWDGVLKQRKSVLLALATSCAARVRDEQAQIQAKRKIWNAWKVHRSRIQSARQAPRKRGIGLNRALRVLSIDDETNDGEDIWLTLD